MDVIAIPERMRTVRSYDVGDLAPRQVRLRHVFAETVGDVDTESVDPPIGPEAHGVSEVCPHVLVFPVEIRLLGRETGNTTDRHRPKPMPTHRRATPNRSAAVRRLGRPGRCSARSPGAAARGKGLPKPAVPIGRVIGHDVDDHLDVSRMQRADHRVEVVQAAQSRVDVAVIIDVIAAIGKRGWIERAEPHRIDTERLQVRHARGDTWEVAYPVTGAVGEAARVDLVDHRIAPQVCRDRRTGTMILIECARHLTSVPQSAVDP